MTVIDDMDAAAFRADRLIPRLRAASERIESFCLWKHVEPALAGTSDADCSVEEQDLDLATQLVTAARPDEGPYWLARCDHVHGVRILFLYFEYIPDLFVPVEIDLKYKPSTRMGLPWAHPSDLAACSVLAPPGVRRLAPSASDLVQLINYGTMSRPSAGGALARLAAEHTDLLTAVDPTDILPRALRNDAVRRRIANGLATRDPIRLQKCARELRLRLILASGLQPKLVAQGFLRRVRGEHAPKCEISRLVFSGAKLSARTAPAVLYLGTTDNLSWVAI